MKRLIRPHNSIWIALILSLFIHFFLISYFYYLLEDSFDQDITEKSYLASIFLEKVADSFSPIIENFDIQVTEGEILQNMTETKEKNHQIEKELEEKLPSEKIVVPTEKGEEEPLEKDKKISIEYNQYDQNSEIKTEIEESLAIDNQDMEKEMEQEKAQNLPIQSKNEEYLNDISVQEDSNRDFLEVIHKDESQAIKNSEVENPLDFTGDIYTDNVNPPELLEFQYPVYPKSLRERGIEGGVILKVMVDTEGKVEEIQIFKSSGYEAFDQIAVKAVWQWRFKPARKGDQARESWVLIPISFQIK